MRFLGGGGGAQAYPVDLVLEAEDDQDLLHDVTRVLKSCDVVIRRVNLSPFKDGLVQIDLTIEVVHIGVLQQVFNKLQQLVGVLSVKRCKR